MQKSYLGTQILVYAAAVQIVSIPQLVNSPEAHHAAAEILLTYELFLCLLLAIQIRGIPRRKPLDVPAAIGLSVQPRLWTPTNAAAILTLGGSAVAAWKSRFLPIPTTAGAIAVLLCTFLLYRRNREHWRAAAIKFSTECTARIT